MRRLGALVVLVWVVLAVPGPAAADAGPWVWPLSGERTVARGFSPPATAYGAGHRGVDLASAPGAPVRAAGAGRVSYAGLLAGRPVLVVVHGALRTTYEPVTSLLPIGAMVEAGEVVGRLEPGHLGCPAAACLHWGLRRGEQYLDPTRLVRPGPARLLPVGPRVGVAGDAAGLELPPHAVALPPVAPERPEPAREKPSPWVLRGADAPLAAAGVAALVAGVALLRRPGPRPDDPAPAVAAAKAADDGPPAELLDLERARLRRHVS